MKKLMEIGTIGGQNKKENTFLILIENLFMTQLGELVHEFLNSIH